jgi:cytochrome c551/c552
MKSGFRNFIFVVMLSAFGLFITSPVRSGDAFPVSAQERSQDQSPVVKITAPDNNSSYSWNSLVSYSIVVSYQGKSTQYQEIPSNEVLLKATSVPDLSKIAGQPAKARTPAGLLDIIRSNCIGCHQFKAKAMGPSFAAIARRYPDNPSTLDTLSRHIREGSAGLWGQGSMPPHSDLTADQLQAIALWIEKDSANPDANYYVGTDGAIRMQTPAKPGPTAGMVLTASYTSPAAAANPEAAPYGEDTVMVRGH